LKISLVGIKQKSDSMATIDDFSAELLNKIFSKLGRESLLAASNVCVSWRRVIHNYTSPPSNMDSDLQEKLEKCGWIMSEHDIEKCKCIELNTSLLKFIGNRELSFRVLCQLESELNDDILFGRSGSKLCFISKSGESISVLDATKEKAVKVNQWNWGGFSDLNVIERDPRKKKDILKRQLYIKDNTLMLVDAYLQPFVFIVIRVHMWNLNTLQYVTELDYHDEDKFVGLTSEEYAVLASSSVNATVVRVEPAFGANELALNIMFSIGDLTKYQTQIWKFDPAAPSSEEITYLSTIEQDFEYPDYEQVYSMIINSKLLCIAIHSTIEDNVVLYVYSRDDPNHHTTMIAMEETPENEIPSCVLIFESEVSNKIACLDEKNNILQVYKFDDVSSLCFKIDLNQFVANNPRKLSHMVFLMGKLVIVIPTAIGGQFQCIIVKEDGEVIEGKKQNFLYGEVMNGVTVDGIVTYVGGVDEGDDSAARNLFLYH